MAYCELFEKCPFFRFKLANLPAVVEMYEEHYCSGNQSACARYVVFQALGRDKVPIDLFPNQVARGKAIIANA